MMLTAAEVNEETIKQSKIFHFGTLSMTAEGVREATKKAVKTAKENGCLISFDPNLRPPLWESLELARTQMEYGFANCDILKISDNEIQFVSGKEDYDEGIQYLIDKYNIPLILLTMGADGSRAYYKGQKVEQAGFEPGRAAMASRACFPKPNRAAAYRLRPSLHFDGFAGVVHSELPVCDQAVALIDVHAVYGGRAPAL